jgi:tetratricopeptide (TPR) repeat protein
MNGFPRLRLAVFTAVLTLCVSPLFASDPWDSAAFSSDPKELVAAAEKVSSGDAGFVVLLDEANYTFEADGKSHTTQRHIYRVVDDSAVEGLGTIEVPWAPWYNDRPTVAARVVSKDGTVHTLDAKAIIEAPAREDLDIFSDNRVLRAPLPGVAVGSVIEYVIEFNGNNPIGDAGTSDIFVLGGYAPTQRTRMTIDGPSSLEPRIVNKSDLQAKTEEKNGRRITTFESGRIEGRKDFENFLPFDVINLPYIAFSTGSSWRNLATRYSEIVDKQIAGNDVKKFTHDAIGNAAERRDVIARALAAVEKNVRYAGVEVGESSIVPRPPLTVLGNKYGDCKDKATLLVAMLRVAGIPAHVALLRAGEDFDVLADLPGMGRFNHAIVRVDATAKDPAMWVDPTDDFAHAGDLPSQDQGRLALIAVGDTSALTKTPETPSAANRYSETRTYTLPEDGKAHVLEVSETVTGSEDSFQRHYYAESDRTKYREQIETYVKSYYGAKKLDKVEATDPHDLTKPFRVTIEASDAETGVAHDGDAAVAFHPANLINWLPFPLRNFGDDHAEEARRKRAGEFVFPAAGLREWTYHIVPPAGYTVRTLPPNETTNLGTTTLSKEFHSQPDGSVMAVLRFDSGKRRISASEFEETRAAIKKAFEAKATIIGFDLIGQAKLNAGDVTGALAEFRKLVALHPKEAQHHIEIARALLIGGLGDAARAEIQRAVTLEPSNAHAQAALAGILEYDLLGRLLRKGFDMDGAIAALRKAKTIDPKNADYRGALAKLLTYGSDGTEYGPGAKLDESIAEYRAVATEVGEKESKQFDDDLMPVLAHAGRFAEMKDLARTVQDTQLRETGRIIAIAATDGPAAALHELGAFDANTRRNYAQTVAQMLLNLRLYPQATEMYDAATQGAPNASSARPFIEALRKTKRIEELPLDEKDPRSVVQKMIMAMVHNDTPALKKLFAFDIKPIEDEEDGDDPFSVMRTLTSGSSMPPAVIGDLSFGTMRVQSDGNDKSGYRLRLRSENGVNMPTLFVVRQNGGYIIRASTFIADTIGAAVLAYADAGDLETARTWLNWLREDVQAGGGDDPLRGVPFAALWPKDNTATNADEIRTAAASMMIRKGDGKSIPILLAMREKAANDRMKSWIDVALSASYANRKDWKSVVPIAERLNAAYPDSDNAFSTHVFALSLSGRTADAEELAKKRLAKKPKDDEALRALSSIAAQARDYAAAAKYAEQLVDELSPTQNDYNNAAWFELFAGNVTHAMENARRATAEESQTSAAALHTLATLYAETGKNIEARDALLRTLDKSRRDQPDSSDWYVLGRMAENYGVRDAALAAYKRVVKKEEADGASVWELAQRRLAVMGKS